MRELSAAHRPGEMRRPSLNKLIEELQPCRSLLPLPRHTCVILSPSTGCGPRTLVAFVAIELESRKDVPQVRKLVFPPCSETEYEFLTNITAVNEIGTETIKRAIAKSSWYTCFYASKLSSGRYIEHTQGQSPTLQRRQCLDKLQRRFCRFASTPCHAKPSHELDHGHTRTLKAQWNPP
jgi:hypothetical protein